MTSPLRLSFGPQTCGSLAAGGQREWLVPDGLGGFAMGTVSGLRTRRYHGLLVVATDPPLGRQLGLAALDGILVLPSGARVPLGIHEWAGGHLAPTGHTLLESFALTDGLPRWRWRVGDVVLERTLAMQHGAPSVAVVHTLLAGGPVRLEVEALTTWRDVHSERHAYGALLSHQVSNGAVIENAFRLRGPGWEPGGEWYLGVHARAEAARGLAAVEDLWYAGRFSAELAPGDTLEVSAWAGDLGVEPPPASAVVAAARQRSQRAVALGRARDETDATLLLAADSFVVTTPSGPDVVAGYPWFGAWARDTMTSYEGLFLETGRAEEGRRLLERYAATLSEGMLANTADTGATEYNTADGTLWFLHAVARHVEVTGDLDLGAQLAAPLARVVEAHIRGTRYGIRIDPDDGLLTQGQDGFALTWMDARVDGVGITPRAGKAVELNALWIRGLAALRSIGVTLDSEVGDLAMLESRAKSSFLARFPTPFGWLHDVVDGPYGDDASLRPNQLLAFSLPNSPLAPDDYLPAISRELLTPVGLRSLAPSSPEYRGQHRGDSKRRDSAYHQGTVWPWLIGPYAEAAARAGQDIAGVFDGLEQHLGEWGLGSVSETADGDAPHAGTGCAFQAWSVAEVLRTRRLIH